MQLAGPARSDLARQDENIAPAGTKIRYMMGLGALVARASVSGGVNNGLMTSSRQSIFPPRASYQSSIISPNRRSQIFFLLTLGSILVVIV